MTSSTSFNGRAEPTRRNPLRAAGWFLGLLSIALVLLLSVIGIGIAVLVAVGWWILYPLDQLARTRTRQRELRQLPGGQGDEQRVRFSVADFLCLFVLIQVPFVALPWVRAGDNAAAKIVVGLLLAGLGATIWHGGVVTLSKAGVRRLRPRMIILGVILPVVYYGILPFCMLLGFGVVQLLEWNMDEKVLLYSLLEIVLGGFFFWSGVYVRRIVRETAAE